MKKLATSFGLLALMLIVTSFTTPSQIGGSKLPGSGSLAIGGSKIPGTDPLAIGGSKIPGTDPLAIGGSKIPGTDPLAIGGSKIPGTPSGISGNKVPTYYAF